MTPTETASRLRRLADDWRKEEKQLCEQFGSETVPRSMRARRIKDTRAIDAAIEMIERADRLEKVESALSDLLNDLEERAKWNLEASQRVVACGNGVYVRAKAALEKSK